MALNIAEIEFGLAGAVKVEVRVDGLVSRQHVGPVLRVMIRIDEGEDRVEHVSVFVATGKGGEFEFHRFAVGRDFARHARAIASVAIVNKVELIGVDIKHSDRMVVFGGIERGVGFLHFVDDRVSA